MTARPRPQTDGERLVGLETEMCEVRDDVRALSADMRDLKRTAATKADVQELIDELRATARRNDDRYAGKLTERIVYGLVATVSLAVLYALLQLIEL